MIRALGLMVFSLLLTAAVMVVSPNAAGQPAGCLPDVESVAETFSYSIAYRGRVTVDGVPYGEHASISPLRDDLVTAWLQIGPGGVPAGCPPGSYMILVDFDDPLPAGVNRQIIFVLDDSYLATQRPQIPENLETPITVELNIDFATIADIRTGGRTFSSRFLPFTLLVGAVLLTIAGVGLFRKSRRRMM